MTLLSPRPHPRGRSPRGARWGVLDGVLIPLLHLPPPARPRGGRWAPPPRPPVIDLPWQLRPAAPLQSRSVVGGGGAGGGAHAAERLPHDRRAAGFSPGLALPLRLPRRCSSAATRSWSGAITGRGAPVSAPHASRRTGFPFTVGSGVMPTAYPIHPLLASPTLNSYPRLRSLTARLRPVTL